jgi:RNA polymerase sigma-70 factor (ECF subfamily)
LSADVEHVADDELIKAVLDGRKAEYRRLVARYEPLVYGVAMSYLKAPEFARTVTENVFIRAYWRLAELADRSAFRAWLGRITAAITDEALREAKAGREKGEKAEAARLVVPRDELEPLGEIKQAELRSRLYRKVRTLPRKYRTLAILKYVHGRSYSEIADFLGLSVETVRDRLDAVKTRLARYFRAAHSGSPAPGAQRERHED